MCKTLDEIEAGIRSADEADAGFHQREETSSLLRVRKLLVARITGILNRRACPVVKGDFEDETVLGDLALLHEILVDWESGTFPEERKSETPLIACIKGNLGI